MKKGNDRVCLHCDKILRVYPGVGWFHIRLNGQWYVTGHKPEPRDSYEPDSD